MEIVLADHGWTRSGTPRSRPHGVDLLLLGPNSERMFAIEVKGTLAPAAVAAATPRLHSLVLGDSKELVQDGREDRALTYAPMRSAR